MQDPWEKLLLPGVPPLWRASKAELLPAEKGTFATLLQSFPCIRVGTNFPGKWWNHIPASAQKMSGDVVWDWVKAGLTLESFSSFNDPAFLWKSCRSYMGWCGVWILSGQVRVDKALGNILEMGLTRYCRSHEVPAAPSWLSLSSALGAIPPVWLQLSCCSRNCSPGFQGRGGSRFMDSSAQVCEQHLGLAGLRSGEGRSGKGWDKAGSTCRAALPA